MLKKGRYRVAGVLNISRSLSSQRSGTDPRGMHKALLQQESSNIVAYFTDQIEFGPGTVISIEKDLSSPLLTNRDFRVAERRRYRVSHALVERLLK
jgi:hypothetical protein